MMRYVNYFRYVNRHKGWVLYYAIQAVCGDIPEFGHTQLSIARRLLWRALVHDLSKFRPSEFIAYARHFYNADGTLADRNRDDPAYDEAWGKHLERNEHHFWCEGSPWCDAGVVVRLTDEDTVDYLAILEAVCDWCAAGRAQGKGNDTKQWYLDNQDRIKVSRWTRAYLEVLIRGHVWKWNGEK